MNELECLLEDIEKLRKALNELVEQKKSYLLDPDVLSASQMLNAAITKYNEIIMAKLKKDDQNQMHLKIYL